MRLFTLAIACLVASCASAQVSTEEAAARLKEKERLRQEAQTSEAIAQYPKLKVENAKLKERIGGLEADLQIMDRKRVLLQAELDKAKKELELRSVAASPGQPKLAGSEFMIGTAAITIMSAKVEKVAFTAIGGSGKSDEDFVVIRIKVRNTSETKKVDYQTWAGRDITLGNEVARLSDEFDNSYKRVTFGLGSKPVGRMEHESIYPGKEISDVLVFETPIAKATKLKLRLPRENVDGEGEALIVDIPLSK